MEERTIKRISRERECDHLIWHGGEVPYLTFGALDAFPWLGHAYATRIGGVSVGEKGTMNLSLHGLDDEPEAVTENYRRIAAAVGFDWQRTVGAIQVHATKIARVGEEDAGSGVVRQNVFNEEDGFVTDTPGITLCVYFADCVPLFAVDPVHHAIGSAHSGWRGTVGGIGKNLVAKMQREFGSDPEDLVCAIGPSICQDCYEVGEEVVEEFRKNYTSDQMERLFYANKKGRYQLDLPMACYFNFLKAGVKEENISLTDICTCCEKDLIFSHRGSAPGKHGLSAGFLFIR